MSIQQQNIITDANQVRIRQATTADIAICVKLLSTLFNIEADFGVDTECQQEGLRRLLTADSTRVVLVAEIAENVVGMATAQQVISSAEGREAAWVEDVVVFPLFRRRGVAHALLQAVEQWASLRGIRRLQLLADRENSAALSFYAHEEWQRTQLICLRKRL